MIRLRRFVHVRVATARQALVAIVCVAACALVQDVDAHKPVTSKYTYWEDVYPILKEHCGSCHVPGGIAPMSLLTYDAARPWAESIRLELTAGHMPPWFGDPAVAPLKDVHKLSPRDIDVVLTWVSGGTPPGSGKPIPDTPLKKTWPRGRPDVTFTLPAVFTLPAHKSEDTREFVLQENNDRDRLVAAADVLPGDASIVHDALIYTMGSDRPSPNVIAEWVPGTTPVSSGPDTAFVWPAGERLVVRIHYKKTWKAENKAVSDRSTVGLYLLKGRGQSVRAFELPLSGVVVDEDVKALAVRSAEAPSDVKVRVDAIRPDGTREPVGGFSTRAGWDRRYWLARPIPMPKGTRLDVSTSGAVPGPLRLWLDVIRAGS